MESSTVLAFRIFVMLSCLIIVPMAAIFGSAFPDVVKSQLVDRIVSWSNSQKTDAPPAAPGDPAGFGNPPAPQNAANGQNGNWEAPRWGSDPSAKPMEVAPPPSGVIPAGGPTPRTGGNQSIGFSTPVDSARGTMPPEQAGPPNPYQRETGNPADPRPLPNSGDAAPLASAPADRMACPLDEPNQFKAMERKLRQYGATYYLLETWGNDGESYRFHCRMAVGNNPNYTRHFEATDRDALKAMSDVLARVEAWRAGRLR